MDVASMIKLVAFQLACNTDNQMYELILRKAKELHSSNEKFQLDKIAKRLLLEPVSEFLKRNPKQPIIVLIGNEVNHE